ncbi:MAG: NAD-glutamate dehydrogenase [Cellvibrionales bacterium]|nr:NAD-glutamate dehydrogenase [Cellvibrionales bacterium]
MPSSKIRNKLIGRIAAQAKNHLTGTERAHFLRFVEQVIHVHPDEGQLDWRARDNFGALYGLYKCIQNRPAGQPKIQVFNPTAKKEGWTSRHSVIYFCQRDMPFLINSLRLALNRLDLRIHLFESNAVRLRRDAKGTLTAVADGHQNGGNGADEGSEEIIGYVLINRTSGTTQLNHIAAELRTCMADVDTVVSDFAGMLGYINQCIDDLQHSTDAEHEDIAFLQWLRDGNFTFLGAADFRLEETAAGTQIFEQDHSRLGLLKKREPLPPVLLADLCDSFGHFYAGNQNLAFTKATSKSTVHRDVYCDYVVVKRLDKHGKPIGETRFLGLYSSRLYHLSIQHIPLVRQKSAWLMRHSRLNEANHNGKTFMSILEGHPRDELIQAAQEDLLATILGIWKIYERRTVRLFMRVDHFEKFVSCIVYMPREAVKTETRRQIEALLCDRLHATECQTSTQFLAESVLARTHFMLRITNRQFAAIDPAALEATVAELTRSWDERFAAACTAKLSTKQAERTVRRLHQAFPASYRDRFTPVAALDDLELLDGLDDPTQVNLNLSHAEGAETLQLKIAHRHSLELSAIIPLLENLGSTVLVQHPFRLQPLDEPEIWLHEFSLRPPQPTGRTLDISAVRDTYRDAFRAIWQGRAENDTFNRLVFGAHLEWRDVALLRAYARYLKQLGSPLGLSFIASVLSRHTAICRDLIALFRCAFDPHRQRASAESDPIRQRILDSIEQIESLNEDQVLRQYLSLLDATLRTNFYQREAGGTPPECIALKLATQKLEFAPRPRPAFEIYVYAPRIEGVHLRGGKVARGGLRWSDRPQDFRTEVLGLVKAQQVKNAVIVPTGAKGGFVARRAPSLPDREALMQEGIACYRLFIKSLLDVTDNRAGEAIVPPDNLVCRDDPDPYMVVAADKGTASFSDIANAISTERAFWLGDAFASGGSNGYDHKAMGITAKGAWVAVQRHFRELGLDTQSDDFSVIGIGDMGGDVFGNGMLLSKHIRLLAAFNHLHIFIDPDPDPATSWAERKRLFALPRSSWADYATGLISKGGGIFERSTKSIALTPQIKAMLGSEADALTPTALIQALLQAPVDLIWNGGIGTYVKAQSETHAAVGDKANDGLRVNGADLRCRVFGEGGNLGLTQLGRVEYCAGGGVCNTDFIDNAGGVDCSDHEVNIKILLNAQVESGALKQTQRNRLLAQMTDEVAALVLHNNYRQTLAISLARHCRDKHFHDYLHFVEQLAAAGRLDRQLEFLPDNETIRRRQADGTAWTRPELAVLISYAKVQLKEELMDSDLAADAPTAALVFDAFPPRLRQKHRTAILQHRLSREIIATQLANKMVDQMGFTYYLKQRAATAADATAVAHAFIQVMRLFALDDLWAQIEALDHRTPTDTQHELLYQIMRLGQRTTRWFLRNRAQQPSSQVIAQMEEAFAALLPQVAELQTAEWRSGWARQVAHWQEAGVPEEAAGKIAAFDTWLLLPGMVDGALQTGTAPAQMLRLSAEIAAMLSLDWMRQQLLGWVASNHWQDLARESQIDELELLSRTLTIGLSKQSGAATSEILASWQAAQAPRIKHFQKTLATMQAAPVQDLSAFTVALRELQDLVNASI